MILDQPLPRITLAIASATGVREDGGAQLLFTFSRTGALTSPLTVNYSVAGTATPGTDYTGIDATAFSASISFAAGAATATVSVTPMADLTAEADETVVLTLARGIGYGIGTTVAVTGTLRNDDIIGTAGNDTLVGSAWDDYIFAAAGNDTLRGNAGNDRLDGGLGVDVLTGGPGADIFIFRYQQSLLANPDRLTDFAIGQDKIDLLSASGAALPAPVAFSRASNGAAPTLAALVTAVFTDANGAITGNQALAPHAAALVVATAPAIAGTYLVINDAAAGFQSGNDLILSITGQTGTLPALGASPVNSWFA